MPTPKNQRRRHEEKNRRGTLAERASSFHGRNPANMAPQPLPQLRRPKTLPELFSDRNIAGISPDARPKLTKLLLNVTIQRSLGPVQVVMTPESTVGDLVAAAVRQYAKEARRPILPTTDPSGFDLHYSQFSLESLDREEKLMALGSRNFFLCPTRPESAGGGDGATTSSSCSKQAEKECKIGGPWFKFMDFLL